MNGLDRCVAKEAGQSMRSWHYEEMTYFAKAYSPNSRPIPDCLNPPNGICAFKILQQLTQTVPAFSLWATPRARLMFCEKTAAARPYIVSLAI